MVSRSKADQDMVKLKCSRSFSPCIAAGTVNQIWSESQHLYIDLFLFYLTSEWATAVCGITNEGDNSFVHYSTDWPIQTSKPIGVQPRDFVRLVIGRFGILKIYVESFAKKIN